VGAPLLVFAAIIPLMTCMAFSAQAASVSVAADTIVTKGVISDNTGPLPGVSVVLKSDKNIGTVTDANGRFSLRVPANGTLVISSVGFITQEVQINGRQSLALTLMDDVKSLNEVVVIGYGTQSREKLIGSVAQVSGEDIAERPVSQLKQALTGQLPGVIITQRSGQPGVGSGRISVRGVGSFGASQDALILVDGIIVNNFNDIDPNDVENISVLKDASTAAIYGSRASNGVILVTTKSGKLGDPKFTFNSYAAKQKPTVFPDYINSWEYQQLLFEAQNGTSQLTPDQVTEVEKYRAQNDINYPNNDFLDKTISKDGLQVGNSIAASGGTEKTKYNFSFGNLYQDGMVEKNNYTRYNLRLNLNTALSKKFNFTTRLAAISSKVNEPMAPPGGTATDMLGIIGQAARFANTLIDVYPNGDYGVGLANGGTAVSDLASKSFTTDKSLNLTANLRLDYKPISDLTLSFVPGYRRNDGRVTTFRASMRLNDNITLGPNTLRENYSGNEYYILQGLADYKKSLGKHDIDILGGYSYEDFKGNSIMAFRDNLPSNDLTVLDFSSPQNQQSGGNGNEYALESQFLRVAYNYESKYLLQGTVRRDGSSRFPTSQKYAVFPSVGAAWRVAEEPFIRDKFSWLNEFKVKASWGILGNQEIGEYPYQNTLVSNSNT
jgi:TonB-linked SusC/RagA family outer membrane protein